MATCDRNSIGLFRFTQFFGKTFISRNDRYIRDTDRESEGERKRARGGVRRTKKRALDIYIAVPPPTAHKKNHMKLHQQANNLLELFSVEATLFGFVVVHQAKN